MQIIEIIVYSTFAILYYKQILIFNFFLDIDECTVYKPTACIDAVGCDNKEGTWQCICQEGLKETRLNKTSKQCKGKYFFEAIVIILAL